MKNFRRAILFANGDFPEEHSLIIEKDDFMSKHKENFTILEDAPKLNVSSSEYRKTKNKKLLLTKVNQYIKENNLY